ncbi:hypothetical protein BC629DRAFT_1596962 [Irpex lacteus]|nr:hypothetical protein BC629DRAFT_1596962 [Irpex lacteus]
MFYSKRDTIFTASVPRLPLHLVSPKSSRGIVSALNFRGSLQCIVPRIRTKISATSSLASVPKGSSLAHLSPKVSLLFLALMVLLAMSPAIVPRVPLSCSSLAKIPKIPPPFPSLGILFATFPAHVLRFLLSSSRKRSQDIFFVPISHDSTTQYNVPHTRTKIPAIPSSLASVFKVSPPFILAGPYLQSNVPSIRTKIPARFVARKRSQDIASVPQSFTTPAIPSSPASVLKISLLLHPSVTLFSTKIPTTSRLLQPDHKISPSFLFLESLLAMLPADDSSHTYQDLRYLLVSRKRSQDIVSVPVSRNSIRNVPSIRPEIPAISSLASVPNKPSPLFLSKDPSASTQNLQYLRYRR